MLHVIRLFGLIGLVFAPDFCLSQESKYLDTLKAIEPIPISNDLKERIEQVKKSFGSEAFTRSIARHTESLANGISLATVDANPSLKSRDRPMLFISSSIPLPVLRSYAKQLDHAGGGTMILKGFLGGARHIKPTLRFMAEIVATDETCLTASCEKYAVDVIIDPILFSHHAVSRVPAFTVYENKVYEARCQGAAALESGGISYGDASLRALALELANHDTREAVKRFIVSAGYNL